MKKMAWLMVIALAVALAATACGGGGDDDNGGNPFVGTWTSSSYSGEYYTFKADLSYSQTYQYPYGHGSAIGTSSGTYTYSGNTARLDNGTTLTIETYYTPFYFFTGGKKYEKQ